MRILDANAGFSIVMRYLRSTGYNWKLPRDINKNRYRILYGNNDNPNIAITFKKEKLLKLRSLSGNRFKEGLGDCINVEHIKEFIKANVEEIYILFQDGSMYGANFKDILSISYKRQNRSEGKSVRIFPLCECTEIDHKQFKRDFKNINIAKYDKIEKEIRDRRTIAKKITYNEYNKVSKVRIERYWTIQQRLQRKINKLEIENKELRDKLRSE